MAKETRRFRVWAYSQGKRVLEFSQDSFDAREAALQKIDALKQDADIDAIEMREHLILEDSYEVAVRGGQRWVRGDGRWDLMPGRSR